jgi:hypothetical protein
LRVIQIVDLTIDNVRFEVNPIPLLSFRFKSHTLLPAGEGPPMSLLTFVVEYDDEIVGGGDHVG